MNLLVPRSDYLPDDGGDVDQRSWDELVVVRCQLGDHDAWRALVTRWHEPVWTFLWRMLDDRGRSDDLTQELWIRVVRGLPRLRTPERFPAWLFTIARRVVHDELRRAYRRPETDPPTGPDDVAGTMVPDAVDDLVRRVDIARALTALPPRDREVVVLFHLDELPLSDVAEVLDVPVGTVKSRLHRARGQLERRLRDEEMPR